MRFDPPGGFVQRNGAGSFCFDTIEQPGQRFINRQQSHRQPSVRR